MKTAVTEIWDSLKTLWEGYYRINRRINQKKLEFPDVLSFQLAFKPIESTESSVSNMHDALNVFQIHMGAGMIETNIDELKRAIHRQLKSHSPWQFKGEGIQKLVKREDTYLSDWNLCGQALLLLGALKEENEDCRYVPYEDSDGDDEEYDSFGCSELDRSKSLYAYYCAKLPRSINIDQDFINSVARANNHRLMRWISNLPGSEFTWSKGSAFEIACGEGHGEMIKTLIDIGFRVDDYFDLSHGYNSGSRQHPLFVACKNSPKNGHFCVVDALLDAKVNKNVRQEDGKTVLMQACQDGNLELVEYLLDKGFDVNCVDDHGRNALYYAVNCTTAMPDTSGNIINKLQRGKINMNTRDVDGHTGDDYLSLYAVRMRRRQAEESLFAMY